VAKKQVFFDEAAKNSIFVSIHINSFSSKKEQKRVIYACKSRF